MNVSIFFLLCACLGVGCASSASPPPPAPAPISAAPAPQNAPAEDPDITSLSPSAAAAVATDVLTKDLNYEIANGNNEEVNASDYFRAKVYVASRVSYVQVDFEWLAKNKTHYTIKTDLTDPQSTYVIDRIRAALDRAATEPAYWGG